MIDAKALAACLVLIPTAAWSKGSVPVCRFSEQAIEAPAVADKHSRIQVLGSSPAAGDAVHPATVIGLDVEYHITDFQPGRYELMVLADQLSYGAMIVDNGTSEKNLLTNAHGRAHLCAPLRMLFRIDRMRWPLQINVSLQKESAPGSYVLYAETQKLRFPSPDLSARALEQQKAARSDNFYLALDELFDFHYRHAATYDTCTERFPETAAPLEAPYKGWTSGNEALFARVDELQLQRFADFVRGTKQSPQMRMDEARAEFRKSLQRLSDVNLRRNCDLLPLVFTGDPREFVGRYLALVDAEAPKQ